ncbi:hypothetical protein Q0Z83_053900 [Actinoplanes sichuanensis]|uniref:Class I SAM-dependent methyltransferase n=1 Tax=Actinoplanes sichuanensis TaxID=512349 RepID=A0ABW4AT45_9ACTN|nr:methyltransferase domain-containing protein [Actinoplanes sichuanensis]BEL07199.1 hypothetical protein Q0Z83_053900 [Actinoplanes sichuanensis]
MEPLTDESLTRPAEDPLYRMNPATVLVGTGSGFILLRQIDGGRSAVTRVSRGELYDLVTHFNQPRTAASWLARRPGREQSAVQILESALARGVLLPADEMAVVPESTPEELDAVLESLIVDMARLRTRLRTANKADLAEIHNESDIPPGQVFQLFHLLIGDLATGVSKQLTERIRAAAGELRDSSTEPLRLHLGCGSHRMTGWVNIDLFGTGADLHLDVRDGLPFQDCSAGAAYIAHLLEHLEFPEEAMSVLQECRRVLQPGGTIRLAVPDVRSFATAYVHRSDAFFSRFQELWERPAAPSQLASFLHYAGAGEFPWVGDRHRFGYDEETLAALLRSAGFVDVRRCLPGDSSIGDPELDYSWANSASSGGLPYSLIMEAGVPGS